MESPLPAAIADLTLSRRQVVQTAAWAAPAILIAAQPPAAGASQEATTIVIAGATALSVVGDGGTRRIHVQATVAQASGTSSVRNAVLRFEFPSGQVSSTQTPTIATGAGWSLSSKGTSGGVTYFEYVAAGPVSGSTAPLAISISTTSGDSSTSATIKASALPPLASLIPVPNVSTTVAAVTGSTLLNDNYVGGEAVGTTSIMVKLNHYRWAGSYWPVGPSIGQMKYIVDIDNTLVSGLTASQIAITSGASQWSLASVTNLGSATRLVFNNSTVISSTSDRTVALYFTVPRKQPRAAGGFVVSGTGVTQGVTIPAGFPQGNSFSFAAN